MSVNKVSDLVQLLQQYYATHQAIHNRQPDTTPYVIDTESATISAFEPVKVNISFISEGAGYSNLGGAITLNDALRANPDDTLESLFQDSNNDWARTWDGVESGVLTPFFAKPEWGDTNGGFFDYGNSELEQPMSITLLPGNVMASYLATGYGHDPLPLHRTAWGSLSGRLDYLFSLPEVGSVKRGGDLPPSGSYVRVTDNGNGEYIVAWEDVTGGGDNDFDDVVLKFDIERIPVYKGVASAVIPETATAHNTYAFQIGNAVVEAWYEYDPQTNKPAKLWFKTTALADLPEGYKFKLAGPNGEDLPNIGGNPFTLKALKEGESDIQYFAPVTGPVKLEVTAPPEPQQTEPVTTRGTAVIEKRGIIGYDTKTITFGNKSVNFNIPVLDLAGAVSLKFGKYERIMPNGQTILATVPASVSGAATGESVNGKYYELLADNIAINNPGKPVKPNKANFINPETGKLDKEAYNKAVAEYKKALAEYKTAAKTYKAAVKAAKVVDKGQKKSLKIEQKAIKTVNKALAKLVKGEKKADKYITKAEVSLEKAAKYREQAQQLRDEVNKTLEAKGWTMDDVKEILANKPKKADFVDPATGELDKEAYAAAKATYKEAKAIAKLAKKADKYDLKADKLEVKAEAYQQKALAITAKTAEKFKTTLEKIISKYSRKAESLKASGESLVEKAQGLEGAGIYKALGKGIYNLELSEGYARGAEIATEVLEAFASVDVSVSPDVAASLESVDISNVNVSI